MEPSHPLSSLPRRNVDLTGELVSAGAAPVINTQVISPDRSYYSAWGTVARAPDGTLAVVYSGGREDHVDPFGHIELITSRDNGTTWSWPRVLMDSATDDRDAAIFITSKGTWLVDFYTSIAYQKHLSNPQLRINEVFGAEAPTHIARSELARISHRLPAATCCGPPLLRCA